MKKRPREPKPLHPALASAAGPALIKYLASCNSRVRSQSLQQIQSWLAAQPQLLAESDIRKLWKGLFYCLWHADKTQNQVALINRLTSLFLSLQPPLSLEFFRGFLVTLRREWPGIDRLRLDKFYLLIRRFLKVLFEFLRSRDWDLEVVGDYFDVLDKNGFLADDKHRGNGVNYHVASVFLEELKGIDFPVRNEVVDAILKPFFSATLKSEDKILLAKLKRCFFDELIKSGKALLAQKRSGISYEGNSGGALLGVVALRMGLSDKFYEIGSSVDCIQGNRKLALGLHHEFQKLEKELESSGVEIVIPEYTSAADASDSEVPQLFPLEILDGKINGEEAQAANEAENPSDDHPHDDERHNKKLKRPRIDMNGDVKKKKKKKRRKNAPIVEKNSDSIGVAECDDLKDDDGAIALNETIISNLQKQFERVAAGTDSKTEEDSDSSDTLLASMKHCKQRRRTNDRDNGNPNTSRTGDGCGVDDSEKSVSKSTKKVRFAIENNLVWKPQNPLPLENLRLPPTVTPRGSALKKGVPPGPIIEVVPLQKKLKKKKKKKLTQNRMKRTNRTQIISS